MDYFASMPGVRLQTSAGDLERIRAALSLEFPDVYAHVDRPVVKLTFPDGPYMEIAPAHYVGDDDNDIPDPTGAGWRRSSPTKHREYVNESKRQVPQTKRFVRLLKE
ncbi:hypothetical protein [Microbacterium suaedae]|uniref:hypothetical protein n=1 Tax=Microbacterium suaedae TaxID=2067813 RepID=UPI000DA10C83|nr:hypothetical protein [Microbacterium suaedae]